ncbi:MAG: hypothetical protein CMH27_08700 [Micavibrio sp.]|nr:hypothetical protein [Micavibrio sp.]
MIDMEPEERPEIAEELSSSYLALVALALGMVAFTLSAVTPWAVGAFDPAQPVMAGAAENTADVVTWWESILTKGFAPEHNQSSRFHNMWTLVVMLGSVLALVLGVSAFVRREDTRMSVLAMGFGFLGIFMQYMMVFAGVLLILIMLYLVFASFGIT